MFSVSDSPSGYLQDAIFHWMNPCNKRRLPIFDHEEINSPISNMLSQVKLQPLPSPFSSFSCPSLWDNPINLQELWAIDKSEEPTLNFTCSSQSSGINSITGELIFIYLCYFLVSILQTCVSWSVLDLRRWSIELFNHKHSHLWIQMEWGRNQDEQSWSLQSIFCYTTFAISFPKRTTTEVLQFTLRSPSLTFTHFSNNFKGLSESVNVIYFPKINWQHQ